MKSIMQFFRIHLKQKFIVFGVGSLGEKSLDFIPREVSYFVDNNSNM
jgi:hypothetical protein